MQTLYDLGVEVTKIREAINSIEVKGEQNASLVVYSVKKCNDIIEAINAVSRTIKSSQNEVESIDKEDEMSGQPD